jgi:curved DNA-binding protein CbpA
MSDAVAEALATLGIESMADATEANVRRAYLERARELHPDVSPADARRENEARFKAVSHAYQVSWYRADRTTPADTV